jgi:hypothetical protein
MDSRENIIDRDRKFDPLLDLPDFFLISFITPVVVILSDASNYLLED